MKLSALHEDANFNPTDAIPVSKAELGKRQSGVNTPPLPNSPTDIDGETEVMSVPIVGDTLNHGRAEKFFNVQNTAPDAKTGTGGQPTTGKAPKLIPRST